jgi:hypothetical protein
MISAEKQLGQPGGTVVAGLLQLLLELRSKTIGVIDLSPPMD